LAFLYGACYCAPTAYYIYNEFPDFENVNLSRFKRWWKANKKKTFFQTDRAKVKNFDLLPKLIESYIDTVGSCQESAIKENKDYEGLYEFLSSLYYFGRFSLFNYTQGLWELTNLGIEPTFFNLKEAKSCKDGLAYVVSKEKYLSNSKEKIKVDYQELTTDFDNLYQDLKTRFPKIPVNIWNIETALCAYKKLFRGKRYLGYYIDRQQEEIIRLQENVKQGVDWQLLWDFRKEFYDTNLIGELNGWKGVRKERFQLFEGARRFGNYKDFTKYKRKVKFKTGGCYGV